MLGTILKALDLTTITHCTVLSILIFYMKDKVPAMSIVVNALHVHSSIQWSRQSKK